MAFCICEMRRQPFFFLSASLHETYTVKWGIRGVGGTGVRLRLGQQTAKKKKKREKRKKIQK